MINTAEFKKLALEEEYEERDRFIIFDGHALMYRAFHAFPELTSPQGIPVNAVYGFTRILLTVIRDFEPEYIAVAFDHKSKTKRAEKHESYKANRPPMPEELRPQVDIIKSVVKALNIPTFIQEGEEADDLIGTIATEMRASGKSDKTLTTVVSGDKDLLQLVNEDVSIWIPGSKWTKDTEYFETEVSKKMGVRPNQVVDLKALMGDASDNIPGVPGIGKVTARKLLSEFGSLDKVYQAVDRIAESGEKHALLKGATLKKMVEGKESAFMSQELARIDVHVPIDFDLTKCTVRDYDKQEVIDVFDSLEFSSLVRLLPSDRFEESLQEALF
ncbi:MAG: hypothetical protein GW762_03975 [Candidatus Pacebacteria bacterium]|nr:hypothetical protein [Candidatus Paceibacterota bacterium]